MSLYNKLLRLAHNNPDGIRQHLIPILRQAAGEDDKGEDDKDDDGNKVAFLRESLLRVASENPASRSEIIPALRLAAAGHDAGLLDGLKGLWEKYRKDHPGAKKPPQSLIDKAKGKGSPAKKSPQDLAKDHVDKIERKNQREKEDADVKEWSEKDKAQQSDKAHEEKMKKERADRAKKDEPVKAPSRKEEPAKWNIKKKDEEEMAGPSNWSDINRDRRG